MIIELTHDPEADAMYFLFVDTPHRTTRELDANRILDVAEDGSVYGVELLSVSRGVNLRDLPNADEIGRLLEAKGIQCRW